MNEALLAINRFCYETLNYDIVRYEWKEMWNQERQPVYVPCFLTKIKWNCDTDHMVDKWISCDNKTNNNEATFIHFYVNLDFANQDKMAEWIISNGVCGRTR